MTDNFMPPSIGTKIKINVTAELGNGLHLSDVDFTCEFYTELGRKVCIPKDDLICYDDDNYIAVVDTKNLGKGEYWLRLFARIPDTDCGGYRDEVVRVPTGIRIVS